MSDRTTEPLDDEREVLDLLGVGLGPFGLALAALADGLEGLRAEFLDARPELAWHPGLLLEGATLQVPFLADLVSLVDPTSPWSYLAYLRAHGRLFRFYLSERFQVPRAEYDDYLRWASRALPTCRFGQRVDAIDWDAERTVFRLRVTDPTGAQRPRAVLARDVVLSVGTEPIVPAAFTGMLGKQVVHAADYLDARGALLEADPVTVIGSGQSGAEVFLDLLRAQRDTGNRLRWITRSPAFAPMEYSKLGLEHFTPDYTEYFASLPTARREALLPAQWQLYKGISTTTITEIHDLLYERTIGGRCVDAELRPAVVVESAHRHPDNGLVLGCRQVQQDRTFELPTEAVVLATGYRERRPDLLDPLRPLLDLDPAGRYQVDDEFRVRLDPAVTGRLHVQNAAAHAHGVGTPDLGLGAWRAATILSALTGADLLGPPRQPAFTSFGVPST